MPWKMQSQKVGKSDAPTKKSASDDIHRRLLAKGKDEVRVLVAGSNVGIQIFLSGCTAQTLAGNKTVAQTLSAALFIERRVLSKERVSWRPRTYRVSRHRGQTKQYNKK